MRSIAAILLALATLTGCASSNSTINRNSSREGQQPLWVENPREVFSENRYLSAVGYGADRESAEKNALGQLVAIFGQTVSGETVVSSRFTEAVREGIILVEEGSAVQQAVTSSWEQETVIGAEIKDTWFDGNRTTYAVAVMDKTKAMVQYSELIESNESAIRKLTTVAPEQLYTLESYAQFDLAVSIAEANNGFLSILSVVSPGAAAARRSSMSSPEELRLTCRIIAEHIPISIQVENDRDDRIRAAFASVVSDAGFKVAESEARYSIRAIVRFSEADLPRNPNKFVRYQVDASLSDSEKEMSVMPYNITGREGHATVEEAEQRAVRAAEKKIRSGFAKRFVEFLSH